MMTTFLTFSFKQLQEEQKPWVEHNFGSRPAWQPLLGMVEELGELRAEMCEFSRPEEIKDAVADCLIFMSDFCNALGFDLEEIKNTPVDIPVLGGKWTFANGSTIAIGRLCHSFLKKAQGIRGTPEEHDADMKGQLSRIVAVLADFCFEHRIDMLKTVYETWSMVRLRDFKKHPKNGLTE